MWKIHKFLSSTKRCTQKKIGSFFLPHGVVVSLGVFGDVHYQGGCYTPLDLQLLEWIFGTAIRRWILHLILNGSGVDGSRTEHLTVESYTVVYLPKVILIITGIPSPTHSFIPGLKPSFSANPSHCSLSFLLLDWLHGFPRLFTVTSEHIRFYFLVFLYALFSCRLRAVD